MCSKTASHIRYDFLEAKCGCFLHVRMSTALTTYQMESEIKEKATTQKF